MLLTIAKILISCHLCFLAHHNAIAEFSSVSIQKMLKMNIDSMHFHERNAQFLHLYLNKVIAFCFFVSVISIVSKNMFPKVLTVVGIALWIVFGFHPQLPAAFRLVQSCEHIAIAGGILFIGGCESFGQGIDLEDANEAMKSEPTTQQQSQVQTEKQKGD